MSFIHIAHAFSNVSHSYDQHATIQHMVGRHLVDHLTQHRHHFSSAIDLGCGTGTTTQTLLQHAQIKRIDLLDGAFHMLRSAIGKLNTKYTYYCQDFDQTWPQKRTYDLIFSNMAFQWSYDLRALITQCQANLRTKGVMAFSIPLSPTYHELPEKSRHVFLDKAQILELFENTELSLIQNEMKEYIASYPSAHTLYHAIRSMGCHSLKHRTGPITSLPRTIRTLTYHIGYFILEKQ